MIANVSVHRRANAFAQALEDQVLQGEAAEDLVGASAEVSGETRLLAVADSLAELPRPELDPEVKTVQRAQLIAAMEAAFAGDGAPSEETRVPPQRGARGSHRATKSLGRLRPRSRLSKGLAAGGLTVGVAAGAFSGVAAASSDALPGDSLYGLKRGMEDLRLGLAEGDSDRGRLFLDQAATRMLEALRLMERGRSGLLDHEVLGEIRRALSGVKQDAAEGHRLLHEVYQRDGSLDPIQALNSFTRSHRENWTRLRDRLPAQLTDVGQEVSSVFDAIDQEVGPLRSLLPPAPDGKNARRSAPHSPGDTGTGGRQGPSARPGTKPSAGASDSARRPRPAPSSSSEDEGLLGGSTGGLFDPPSHGPGSPAPSEDHHSKGRGNGDKKKAIPPDVTLPPLIPGLLPDLGIDGESGPK
ncbi:DUF5667 domain-containing protein [Streptomyces sp. MST-110588]|uniref:DUF5667 domain-containing protein n=1 Tax=Streptomyces sp. MST-110588 TaxID=2833628 RepID=UPI001F5D8483|nr:DUF5667 domain-containing protein [Streptomyces sp. MST-110588]UNO41212.1 hypothetical protein KGS77_18590 [Streptomyces sp. MST-110588]